jgi:HK97 family phage major capsid protein
VLNAIGTVMVSEATPNGVFLNPVDFVKMLKAKAVGSGERTDSDGAFSGTPSTIWGLPAVVTTAIATGFALVADFDRLCTLFVREGVNVRVSDADQDDFTKGRFKALAEGRFGLAVWQPTAAAYVPLSFPA